MAAFTSKDSQDDGLWTFLKGRGIPEENIQEMQKDHIDSLVVGEVDDETLSTYVPAYGDRIAVRRFCMEKQRRGGDPKKLSLFEKLKRKMETKTNKDPDEEHSKQMHMQKNKRALKTSRTIELGWLHDKRMVRKRNGGGTRVIEVSKSATKKDILSHAKILFFPNGRSKKGMWEEFVHSIVDFQEADLSEDISVGELYETSKFGILRFYLSTETVTDGDDIFTEEVEADKDSIAETEQETKVTEKTKDSGEQQQSDKNEGTSYMGDLFTPTVEIIDLTSLCNTSEVIFGPAPSGPFMDADADGVSRDVYAAFWTEFLDCAAEGADVRVPSLSPKWQEEEWRSVGRILAKGFKDHKYFPARLAQAFTVAVIFGEHSVSPDLLFDSLMLYLSQSERDLLSIALKDTVVGDDEDELLDLMDRMGVRTVPTQENLKTVLLQVAHKQIIQQPKYALDNIAAVAGPPLRHFFPSVQDLQKMYDDLKPTTRKVLKLITASPSTPAENQSLRFLNQYIRGLDDISLRKMLRFVTGSDVICVKEIEVIFTSVEGLGRRPIAHTCGPSLELPSTYNNYPELRAEIEAILSSNLYSMDIA